MQAVYFKIFNNFRKTKPLPGEAPQPLTELIAWGCQVANNGEDFLSSEAFEARDTLESFVYYPIHTKGGGLVRPLYFKGDRSGEVEFKGITSFSYSITFAGYLSPYEWGWITPNLKHLNLIVAHSSVADRDKMQQNWINTRAKPRMVLKQAPNLEDITLVVANPMDATRTVRPIWRLTPPVQYVKLRLILIANLQERKDPQSTCPLAMLPEEILRNIWQMLNEWGFYYFPEQPKAVSQAEDEI